MKKEYLEPEAKLVQFETEDIIQASGNPGDGEDEDGGGIIMRY